MVSSQDSRGEAAQDLQEEEQDLERQPLLSAAPNQAQPDDQKQQQKLVVESAASASPKHKDTRKGHLRTHSVDKQDVGQCRICLEEESLGNLESPCGCTGTQKYAHKQCIQTWINEKHNAICEICDQPYKGPYTIPPPPQPEAGEQLQVIAPSSLYLTVEDDRVANLLSDVYDDWDDHRQPTVSWCFSLMMFLLFLMFLHSSVSVLPADGGSGSSSSGGPGSPPSLDPSGVPAGSGSSSLPGGAAAGFAAGASLFLMWLLTKLFLIMLPLLMVMRLAARAQEQAAEAAAAAPAEGQAVAGSGGSSSPRYYQSMVARMLGSNGYRGSSSPGHGRSSSLSDLEMEVGAARRAALNRLGRNPTFLGPAAAAALPAGANRPVIAAPVAGDQQHEQVTAAEQRMMAAVRAMVRAALVNAAAHQEHNREGDPPATGNGSAPTRLSGVV